MKTRFTPTKLDWGLLASMSFVVPVSILSIRLKVMCPYLELKPLDFLPLSGQVHGYSAHLFVRIMHNLTHPILLLGYALLLGYLAIRPISRSMGERSGLFLLCGLATFHLVFIISYFITLFLPIGCGSQINR